MISEEEKKLMQKLYEQGLSMDEIAEKIRRSQSAVNYWVNPARRSHVLAYAKIHTLLWRKKNLEKYRLYQRVYHKKRYHELVKMDGVDL